jgi:hypothetical protein
MLRDVQGSEPCMEDDSNDGILSCAFMSLSSWERLMVAYQTVRSTRQTCPTPAGVFLRWRTDLPQHTADKGSTDMKQNYQAE